MKALTVIIKGQNNYGKTYNIEELFLYFKMKLEKRYTVEQVIYALDIYTDENNSIPAPADIHTILNPRPPEITTSEYVQAQRWQERNGYPMFSAARETIEKYEKQQRDKQDAHQKEENTILALGYERPLTKPLKQLANEVKESVELDKTA